MLMNQSQGISSSLSVSVFCIACLYIEYTFEFDMEDGFVNISNIVRAGCDSHINMCIYKNTRAKLREPPRTRWAHVGCFPQMVNVILVGVVQGSGCVGLTCTVLVVGLT